MSFRYYVALPIISCISLSLKCAVVLVETRGIYQLDQATSVAGFKLNSRLRWRIRVF